MMFKTDILFTGYYGYNNTGDDAFVEVAAWGARSIWGKNNLRFLARQNNLPASQEPTKAYPFRIPRTYSLQLDLLLKNTEYLISAGGSTIHSKTPQSSPKARAIKLKSRKGGPKIGGIGVSIGPFKSISDEKAVESYLRAIDFLAVRDQASFDYVSSLKGLPYTPVNAFDLAALLPEIYGVSNVNIPMDKTNKKIVGISVCPYESLRKEGDFLHEEVRNTKLIQLIKELNRNGDIHFRFYVINGNDRVGDYDLTMRTVNQSKPDSYEIINYNKDTRFVWASIAGCDFVISTRLHGAIFACFSNTPFMLNEYHRKCSDFLENIEYNEKYRLYNSEYDVKEKAQQITEIIDNRNYYILPRRVSDMKKQAKLNFTAISL